MARMVELSVVIPVYNEEDNLPLLWPELRGVLEQMAVSFEVLFVEEGIASAISRMSLEEAIEILHKYNFAKIKV